MSCKHTESPEPAFPLTVQQQLREFVSPKTVMQLSSESTYLTACG